MSLKANWGIWKSGKLTTLEKVMFLAGWVRRDITRTISCAWCAEPFVWTGVATTPAVCECRNHMGGPKQQYANQDAAITQLMRRHLRHGPHRIYECPTTKVWHITSQTERRTA